MNIMFYSPKTKNQYLLVPVCANFTLVKKGIDSTLHYHPVYHMMFVCEGSGYLENDNGKYPVRENDIFIVNPGEKHILSSDRDAGMTYFSFNFYLLDIIDKSNIDIDGVLKNIENMKYLENKAILLKLDNLLDISVNEIYIEYDKSLWDSILPLINNLYSTANHYKLLSYITPRRSHHYKEIWIGYFTKFLWDVNNVLVKSKNITLSMKDKVLMKLIIDYLHENVYEKYTLDHLSSKLNYSSVYLCSFFKNKTGITISEYFNKLKINKSCEFLRQTDRSITEISSLLGFCSSNYFCKIFKKEKNMLPKDYRKSTEIS